MIVADTSAIVAILNREPRARDCLAALQANETCVSAGSLAEIAIVTTMRGLSAPLNELVDGLRIEVVPVDAVQAREIGVAYRRWGKGSRFAKLNFGDCFAYTLAMRRGLPLLFVGDDFTKTDVRRVLAEQDTS